MKIATVLGLFVLILLMPVLSFASSCGGDGTTAVDPTADDIQTFVEVMQLASIDLENPPACASVDFEETATSGFSETSAKLEEEQWV